jgi:hypothetical protein
LEPLWSSKISQIVLFSRPILFEFEKISQIWAESQFSHFSQIHRLTLAGKRGGRLRLDLYEIVMPAAERFHPASAGYPVLKRHAYRPLGILLTAY